MTYNKLGHLLTTDDITRQNIAYTIDPLLRTTTLQSPYLTQEILQYDPAGNILQMRLNQDHKTYTYDLLYQLTSETDHQYVYDSLNNRLQEDTKAYNEIASYKSDDTKELRILGATSHAEIGAAIVIELNQVSHTSIHDLQGNLAALILLNGTPPTYYQYTAFGEEQIDGPSLCPWLYPSKRTDATTGLVNFGRCHYLPSLGRWLTPDPAPASPTG